MVEVGRELEGPRTAEEKVEDDDCVVEVWRGEVDAWAETEGLVLSRGVGCVVCGWGGGELCV